MVRMIEHWSVIGPNFHTGRRGTPVVDSYRVDVSAGRNKGGKDISSSLSHFSKPGIRPGLLMAIIVIIATVFNVEKLVSWSVIKIFKIQGVMYST